MNGSVETSYAGDLSPQDAFKLLEQESSAQLVDVRTLPEWSFVGFADLSALGKEPLFVEWQMFPSMDVNPSFTSGVEENLKSADKNAPLLFLCRSGVRSIAAATAMAEFGYSQCFNVLEGFEGDLDSKHHRGQQGGWKVRGLPWRQR